MKKLASRFLAYSVSIFTVLILHTYLAEFYPAWFLAYDAVVAGGLLAILANRYEA